MIKKFFSKRRSSLSDLFSQFNQATMLTLPGLALLAGLGGSLHCVGMCGGLVSATSKTKKEIWVYQIGRLLGYSLLGIFGGTVGHLFSQFFAHSLMALLPALTLGCLFILWGYKAFRGEREIIKAPGLIGRLRTNLLQKIIPSQTGASKSFGVGLFSILLPCGFLYSLIIVVVSFHDPLKAFVATFFFWVGTLPALTIAPELILRNMKRFLNSSPKMLGASFMIIGVVTILYRINTSYQLSLGATCH